MRSPVRPLTAALACTLALAACGSQPSDRATSASDTSGSPDRSTDGSSGEDATTTGADDLSGDDAGGATTIPDDFPLASGMGGPGDDIPTSRSGTGLRDLTLCGTTPLRGVDTRDRMVADNSGGEALSTRELLLLGTPDEAAELAQSLSDLPTGCNTTRTGEDGWVTATEVRESPFGSSPTATLVQTYTVDGEAAPGATVVHVVQVGASLLASWTYGEWDDVAVGVDQTAELLRETVDALAIFATGTSPSSEAGPQSAPTEETSATAIPDDFPLALGLPPDDGETKVSPPSPDGEGMGVVELCGQEVWPLSGTPEGGRLVTGALGPEYFDGRELVVHADAQLAAEAMTVFRRAAQDCRTDGQQVWTVLDRDTGHDTVTVGLTYDRGLGSSVFQVTRVGSARLMVQTYGEGSLAWLDEQADGVTGTTVQILPAMCVFTKTGC